MRIAVLTDTDKPRYMVFELTEEQYQHMIEDYADQAYEEWREGVRTAYMQKKRMQNMDEYTETEGRNG